MSFLTHAPEGIDDEDNDDDQEEEADANDRERGGRSRGEGVRGSQPKGSLDPDVLCLHDCGGGLVPDTHPGDPLTLEEAVR